MADSKISDLTAATTLADTDLFVIGQEDTANKKVTFATLKAEAAGMQSLFDSTLGADAAAIDTGAAGIPQTANHLMVVALVRTTQAVEPSSVAVTFNNDTGNNYDVQRVMGSNVTASAVAGLAAASLSAEAPGASAEAGAAGLVRMMIPAYRQTTFHKVGELFSEVTDDTAASNRVALRSFRWKSTAAISRLAITAGTGDLLAGSRLTIYGLF